MSAVAPPREVELQPGGRTVLNPISIALTVPGSADAVSITPAQPLVAEWAGPQRRAATSAAVPVHISDFGKTLASLRQGLAQPFLLPYFAVVFGFGTVLSSTSSIMLLVAMLRTYRTTADTQALASVYGAGGSTPTRIACCSRRIASYRLYVATFAVCVVELAAMIAICTLCIVVIASSAGRSAIWCGPVRNAPPNWASGLLVRNGFNCLVTPAVVLLVFAALSTIAILAKVVACLCAIVAWNALFRAAGAEVDEYVDVSCITSCRDTE